MTSKEVKRGRPKGSKDPKKIKLKVAPKDAKHLYKRQYGDIGLVAVYGVDSYTTELVRYLWKDLTQEFVVCDPVDQRAANLTREIGSLPYSMYRYEAVHHVGFLESGMFPVIVCSKEYYQELLERDNPHGVEIVCLEDI